MNIQLENLGLNDNVSFKPIHNPKLNDLFFWHFHPELELVYIEGVDGIRHVGNHISSYKGSDLVFIGANIPHLNFDYSVQGDYRKEVLHINSIFKNTALNKIPEFSKLATLFEKSQYGIAFTGETKKIVGKRLKKLEALRPYEQFLEILHIFEILASSSEYELLHKKPFINKHNKKSQQRLKTIYAYIDDNYQRKISLEEMASLCNLEKVSFCRYFKNVTGTTFVEFLNQYRISQAKRLLMTGKNISEACYDCGFDSLSYFNRTFKKVTTENPSSFKKRILNN
ncbi:MAG: AraC family transcriptional regulator [Cellulophaga sp.]